MGAVSALEDAASSVVDAVGDVVGDVVDTVSDVGSSIDDFVREEIPGGWVIPVAVATAGALGGLDGLLESVALDAEALSGVDLAADALAGNTIADAGAALGSVDFAPMASSTGWADPISFHDFAGIEQTGAEIVGPSLPPDFTIPEPPVVSDYATVTTPEAVGTEVSAPGGVEVAAPGGVPDVSIVPDVLDLPPVVDLSTVAEAGAGVSGGSALLGGLAGAGAGALIGDVLTPPAPSGPTSTVTTRTSQPNWDMKFAPHTTWQDAPTFDFQFSDVPIDYLTSTQMMPGDMLTIGPGNQTYNSQMIQALRGASAGKASDNTGFTLFQAAK